jgi:Fructose-bisphosphate aldolase class-II
VFFLQPTLIEEIGTGVITGDKVMTLFKAAKKHGFAIPAVNVISSSSCNAVMEAAAALNSPIIIQVGSNLMFEMLYHVLRCTGCPQSRGARNITNLQAARMHT